MSSPKRYRVAGTISDTVWLDTETGVSFAVSDTPEYKAFKEWLDDGNTPDPALTNTADTVLTPRQVKVREIVAAGKEALAEASLTSTGEKTLGAIFAQTLDSLQQLEDE